MLCPKPIRLHLTLDHIQRVTAQPKRLARQSTVQGNLVTRDLFAINLVSGRIRIHQPLKRQEPQAVRLRLAQHRHHLAPVQPRQHAARLLAELAHAVPRTRIQPAGAVRLGLQADAHVLNGARDDRVGDARKGAGRVVLAVPEVGDARDEGLVGRGAALLEEAAGRVEGAELDGDAGADAQERGQGAFVEGERAFVLVDGGGGGEGGGVLGGGLEADFDYVKGLACRKEKEFG